MYVEVGWVVKRAAEEFHESEFTVDRCEAKARIEVEEEMGKRYKEMKAFSRVVGRKLD